jgi:hypothetical protein
MSNNASPTKAQLQLAPDWLPRQQRRHVDRALHKLIQRANYAGTAGLTAMLQAWSCSTLFALEYQ